MDASYPSFEKLTKMANEGLIFVNLMPLKELHDLNLLTPSIVS